jgi:hypothetical protein
VSTEAQKPVAKKYLIKLKGVRLSYPNLFKPAVPKTSDGKPGTGEPKFSATFIMDKVRDKAQIDAIKAAMGEMLTEFNVVDGKVQPLAPDKYCLRGGEYKPGKAGYGPDVVFITSSNTANRPPVIVDERLQPMAETDKRLFAGCYVNATIRLWFQNNANGKRINGSLEGVQYVRPGEPFGEAQLEAEDMFEAEEGAAAPAGGSGALVEL